MDCHLDWCTLFSCTFIFLETHLLLTFPSLRLCLPNQLILEWVLSKKDTSFSGFFSSVKRHSKRRLKWNGLWWLSLTCLEKRIWGLRKNPWLLIALIKTDRKRFAFQYTVLVLSILTQSRFCRKLHVQYWFYFLIVEIRQLCKHY